MVHFFAMKLRKDSLQGIERFLSSVPPKTAKRGRGYFLRGDVLELECVESDHLYSAVVRGGMDYEVGLEFADGEWAGQCSCPVGAECKHIVATLMELRKRSTPNDKSSASIPGQIGKTATANGQPPSQGARFKRARVPQPPRSPLHQKLTENLGRELLQVEAGFVRQVQCVYDLARSRGMTGADLNAIAGSRSASASYNYWEIIELWPDFPRDDLQFWLYVAWELRRRNVHWPEFMDSVVDLAAIEKEMCEWERKGEIEQWKERFREFDETAPPFDPRVLELRLAVFEKEARLQWRLDPNAGFTELKQAQAKRFAEQFNQGALVIAPESLALWSATYKPWSYESWWSFKYDDSTARPALGRLLRMPLAADRVVMGDGRPLARAAEPLRFDLRAPQDNSGNYELALATSEGAPSPPILCKVQGRPTLYLTEAGLFHGPPGGVLDLELRQAIPAEALETADGLRFLHTNSVPLPEHLRERVRTEPLTVTVSCGLRPIYPGSPSEGIVVRVTAEAPGIEAEEFTLGGWDAEDGSRSQHVKRGLRRNSKSKPDKGVLIIHDRTAQGHFPRVLESLGVKWGGYLGGWELRLTKKTPELFVAWLKSLPTEIEVRLDKELATLRDEPVSGTLSLDIAEAGVDWFDLKVALDVGDTQLTPEELKLLLNARGGYVRLGKKGWRRLQYNLSPEEDEQLARIGLNARDFSSEPQRFHALQLADDAAKRFLTPERVENIRRRVSELKTRVTPGLPPAIRAEMRPYQTEGFHFLAYLASNRFGGVLADDMGLGKTLQTLAWLAWLREHNGGIGAAPHGSGRQDAGAASTLVVCPKSVMNNWQSEAGRFYPGLRVRLWRGEPFEELAAARDAADLIVVNYAQLRALSPGIADMPWLAAILDEAQYIKNPDSQTAQSARALKARHLLALTGTPIENRLLDLWSILAFAMPGALGNRAHFLRRFDVKDDPLARRRLAARVRPFLLRRAKSQVARDLPDRVEEDILCEMEGCQQTLYRAELKRARQLILGLKSNRELNEERFSILTSLLRLRQICCHPALVDKELRDEESAKLGALEDLLEPLMAEGHKVLVFSQFVTMLELLRETMKRRGWPYFYLAGDTENRGELVETFQSAKDGAVFLISLKAGGFGLNLTAASYVVLFDPWWNPAVENQAIDRTHRIGQTSKVMAYRLLMRDSIEQKIRLLQKQKGALAEDVLGEERFAQSLTLDDLRFLFTE
jgi:hypothetical protein